MDVFTTYWQRLTRIVGWDDAGISGGRGEWGKVVIVAISLILLFWWTVTTWRICLYESLLWTILNFFTRISVENALYLKNVRFVLELPTYRAMLATARPLVYLFRWFTEFYHIRSFRQIRSSLDDTMALCRISTYFFTPGSVGLHFVWLFAQAHSSPSTNPACSSSRVVLNHHSRTSSLSSSELIKQLHWLHIEWRIYGWNLLLWPLKLCILVARHIFPTSCNMSPGMATLWGRYWTERKREFTSLYC